MIYSVISLQNTPERLEAFYKNNPFIAQHVEVFAAIDGRHLSASQIAEIKNDDNKMLPGEIGCALSHKRLWEKAVATNQPLCVFEDDAVLHPCFLEKSSELLADKPDFDFILWGWSYNSTLEFDFFDGLLPGAMVNLDHMVKKNINKILATKDFKAILVKLQKTFGLFAYSISPMGAKKMLEKTFPVEGGIINYIVGNKKVPIFGIDTQLNKVFKDINAFAALPPLAYHTSGQGSIIRGKYLGDKI